MFDVWVSCNIFVVEMFTTPEVVLHHIAWLTVIGVLMWTQGQAGQQCEAYTLLL